MKARAATAAPIALLVLLALQVACVLPVPLRYNAGAAHDEALFMQQAMHIAAGEWLGPYSMMTLAKGPGFSLWLAFVQTLQLPVNVAAALGWGLANVLLYAALRPALPGAWLRVGVVALVLFTPEALGDYGLLRELIYPTLVLATTAAGLGLMLCAGLERRCGLGWPLLLGMASAALVLTREEWVLMAPLWLPCGLLPLIGLRWRPALATVAVGVAAVALPLATVAGLNRHHYGVFTLLEVNSRPFTEAFGALARVRHAATLPHVPVPRETWTRIAAVSPAFAELLPLFNAEVGTRWAGPSLVRIAAAMEADEALRIWFADQIDQPLPAFGRGTAATHIRQRHAEDAAFRQALERFFGGPRHAEAFLTDAMEREIGGAFFIWALRDAAGAVGHHADAASAQRFYRRMADEVNGACTRGALDCRRMRSGLNQPLIRLHREALPRAFAMAGAALLTSENHTTASRITSMGEPSALAAAERFVHAKLAPPHTQLKPTQPQERLIELWRHALPVLAVLAALVWLARVRRVWRGEGRALWLAAGVVLGLVLARLLMVALIHVSAWPAAIVIRYLAPAQPLVLLFVALALLAPMAPVARADTRAPTA